MKSVTTHQAKTHLSRLLKEAQAGEVIIIRNGSVPVAKLTSLGTTEGSRPRVGTTTSAPVGYTAEAFAPLSDDEMREWEQ